MNPCTRDRRVKSTKFVAPGAAGSETSFMAEWDLLKAVAVLFSVAFVASLVKDRYLNRWPQLDALFLGVKYGLVALAGMFTPLVVVEGVRYDARVPFVALAALFGGPLPAVIAALPPLVYRLYLGGLGVVPGVLSLLSGILTGLVFRYFYNRERCTVNWMALCLLGLAVTLLTLFWTIFLPANLRHLIIFNNGPAIGSVYFLSTFVFGALELQDTRRREKDLILANNEKLLAHAQKIGRFGIATLDLDTRAVRLSSELQVMHGGNLSSAEVPLSDLIAHFIHPDDQRRVETGIEALSKGQPQEPIKYRVRIPNQGEHVFILYHLGTETDGAHRTATGLIQDITDRNILFEQMSHTARLATLGEMAASLGHEISNPLAVARMNAERLELRMHNGQGNEPSSQELIRKLMQRLDTVGSLIKGVAFFARSDTEALRPTSLHRAICESVDFFRELAAADATSIEMRLESTEYLVQGSPLRFQQILFNLLNNARHATEGLANPRVTVSTRNIDGVVELCVHDNGPGIPPEIQSKIFTPFFTTKERGKGTGLGLSITDSLVKDLGGSIRVESSPTSGTTFKIVLPILKLETRHHASPSATIKA